MEIMFDRSNFDAWVGRDEFNASVCGAASRRYISIPREVDKAFLVFKKTSKAIDSFEFTSGGTLVDHPNQTLKFSFKCLLQRMYRLGYRYFQVEH